MDERRHHKRSRSRSIDEPQDSRCHDLYLHGDARPGWRRSLSPAFDHPLFNEREILNGYSNGSWRDSQQRLQRSEHSIERFEQCERYGRNNFREVRRSRSRTSSPFRNRYLTFNLDKTVCNMKKFFVRIFFYVEIISVNVLCCYTYEFRL